ncbi:MAG TPA: anaerobic ribonucleoside-triphosphate reductase activating protein [Syntrophaceae bacterium]|jgi:pyruvate formate lyase activating enzyme|nr:anaerobic ribonucleoside-triphosphate reductase activating protein [Syntrophaceae bacterium]
MKIGALQKVSLIDYPGEICAIVFTQGCNFRCPYCHNPELVNPELYNERLPEEVIFSFLAKRKGKIDAVTITGGEPTIQHGLIDFVKRVRKKGYSIKIDTNGSNPEVIDKLLSMKLLDYIAMDIKSPAEKHKIVTRSQINFDTIKQTIELIMKSGIPYEFRTTALKKLLEENDILDIASLIKNARLYVLQQFIPSKVLDRGFIKYESYSRDELESLSKKIAQRIANILIR